jgi:hypothetical protein
MVMFPFFNTAFLREHYPYYHVDSGPLNLSTGSKFFFFKIVLYYINRVIHVCNFIFQIRSQELHHRQRLIPFDVNQ